MPPSIMIISGEASGELHGANLIQAMRKLHPDLQAYGMGGTEMTNAGVEILVDISRMAVVGLIEVFGHFFEIRKAKKLLEETLALRKPDLLILIDYPDFNLMLASKAKKLGIPVFYYISPQVWAWRQGRVKKIQKLVARMAVILPFEAPFYKHHHVAVDFVGHPLLDVLSPPTETAEVCKERNNLPMTKKVIGILPGSRLNELKTMLPVFLQTACLLQQKMDCHFLLFQAPSLQIEDFHQFHITDYGLSLKIIAGNRYDIMTGCDLMMAASGTVTLELAILKIPMIVAYRMSALSYLLVKPLVKVPYISLVNLIADREIIPEFIQDEATPELMAPAIERLLRDTNARQQMVMGLQTVTEALGFSGAADRAAKIASTLISLQ